MQSTCGWFFWGGVKTQQKDYFPHSEEQNGKPSRFPIKRRETILGKRLFTLFRVVFAFPRALSCCGFAANLMCDFRLLNVIAVSLSQTNCESFISRQGRMQLGIWKFTFHKTPTPENSPSAVKLFRVVFSSFHEKEKKKWKLFRTFAPNEWFHLIKLQLESARNGILVWELQLSCAAGLEKSQPRGDNRIGPSRAVWSLGNISQGEKPPAKWRLNCVGTNDVKIKTIPFVELGSPQRKWLCAMSRWEVWFWYRWVGKGQSFFCVWEIGMLSRFHCCVMVWLHWIGGILVLSYWHLGCS